MPVNRDDVVMAYRYILGREPENETVVRAQMNSAADLAVLRRSFLGSEEVRRLGRPPLPPTLPLNAPPLLVETRTDAATLAAVVARTASYWERIGVEAPHWSVLTAAEFKPDQITENEAQFYATGQNDLDLLLGLLRRIGRHPTEFNCVTEFGCGVGRFTGPLADTFPLVKALDISRPHLDLARRWLDQTGRRNVELHQVTPADLHPGGGFSLWWCRMVLQHNPPPVMYEVLNRMLRLLEPGGVAVFQVPTHHVGYHFSIDEYLQDQQGQRMEMHVLPQRVVLDLLRQHGCHLLDLREDTPVVSSSADWLSNCFTVGKD